MHSAGAYDVDLVGERSDRNFKVPEFDVTRREGEIWVGLTSVFVRISLPLFVDQL